LQQFEVVIKLHAGLIASGQPLVNGDDLAVVISLAATLALTRSPTRATGTQ
jgi:hypothetical protein